MPAFKSRYSAVFDQAKSCFRQRVTSNPKEPEPNGWRLVFLSGTLANAVPASLKLHKAFSHSPYSSLRSISHTDLSQDVLNVLFDGFVADT